MSTHEAFKAFFVSAAQSQPQPPIPPNFTITVPDVDSEEEELTPLAPGSVAQAEGQSFIIQYRDASGNESLRRITVWGIRVNQIGIPILVAKCHERNATRCFRVDRIEIVTDFNGEIREPLSEFYRETFGFLWPVDPIVVTRTEAQERWAAIRKICRDSGVALLSVLALSDGEAIPEEIGEILDYAYACCADTGIEVTDAEAERLARYVRQLRPTPRMTQEAIDGLWRSYPAVPSFLRAGARVIEADGLIHSEEIAALNEFSVMFTGEGAW